ncbi:S41 family peptidase [Luteibacter sp. 22Crub2.1]|uniref:S41 family peptidase n=1 Tax=Luteibacter sp. 22Crub2.1 TaxID=1283288 RepID=UPI0009A80549|nr:S41 family peptidase [Luteibacter sp. 22Crub2.1]SKB59077.1 Periplasmic protease [Luteibacter sp. 22Crub2.1]
MSVRAGLSNYLLSRLFAPLVLVFFMSSSVVEAGIVHSQEWFPINKSAGYAVVASGVIEANEGADVFIDAVNGPGEPSGGSTLIDATPYAGRTITLSADVEVESAGASASLWIRADSGSSRVEFVNTGTAPVQRSDGNSRRDLTMDVPTKATKLLIGVLLNKQGKAHFRALRIVVSGKPMSTVKPQSVLEAAVTIVKQHALNADKIDWPVAEADVRTQAMGAVIPVDVYPAIRSLLARLGDSHSSLSGPYQAKGLQTGGLPSEPAEVNAISDSLGYVKMPAFRGMDKDKGEAFSSKLRGEILSLGGLRGWVVDLRSDSGGNMWPMLAALEPLLGSAEVGSFVSPGKTVPWFARSAGVHAAESPALFVSVPVAVLIGPQTSSSGEAVAIAFHGRPNTRFFGSATSGHSTANTEFPLPDGSVLHLTTAADADRNGFVFGDKVIPDFPTEHGTDEEVLHAAVEWLVSGGGRAPGKMRLASAAEGVR